MSPPLVSPLKLTIQYTNTCNLNCVYCYGDCGCDNGRRELRLEEWKGIIDYLVANGVLHVFFEGGEPFHRPDFLELVDYCGRKLWTWIRTNGSLVTPALA